MCIENHDSLCTSEQRVYKTENSVYTPMTIAAARALNQCVANSCGLDAEDQWKIYSADFLNDAQLVLDAAASVQQKANADVMLIDWSDKRNQIYALQQIGGYYHDGPYRLGLASEGCHEIAKAIGELK